MCFDKTGTITEEGLDFYGIRIVGYDIGFLYFINNLY
jgi:magnesium-transporting ATPase (P-type)